MRRRDFLKAALALPLLPVIAQAAEQKYLGVDWASGADKTAISIVSNASGLCRTDFAVYYELNGKLEVAYNLLDEAQLVKPGDIMMIVDIPAGASNIQLMMPPKADPDCKFTIDVGRE